MTARLRTLILGGCGCGGCCALGAVPAISGTCRGGCVRCSRAGAAAGGGGGSADSVAGLGWGGIGTEGLVWPTPLHLLDGMDGGGGVHSGGCKAPPRLHCAGAAAKSRKLRNRGWGWEAGLPCTCLLAGCEVGGDVAMRMGGLLDILMATPFFLVGKPGSEGPLCRTGLSPPLSGPALSRPHVSTFLPTPSSPPLRTRPTQLLLLAS